MPDISRGEHEARRDATSMLYENDAKVAASILGWGPEKILGIQRIISLIREQKSAEANPTDSAGFLVSQIQMMLDHHKPDAGSADEWFPEFLEWITEFARQMQPVVRSEVVFFALLYAAFEKSLAHVNLKKICNNGNVWRELEENERSRRAALASGKQFKLTSSGRAVTEDEDEFHLIAEMPITAETAMFDKIIPLSRELPIRTMGEPTRFQDLNAGSSAPQDEPTDPVDVPSKLAAASINSSLAMDLPATPDLPGDDCADLEVLRDDHGEQIPSNRADAGSVVHAREHTEPPFRPVATPSQLRDAEAGLQDFDRSSAAWRDDDDEADDHDDDQEFEHADWQDEDPDLSDLKTLMAEELRGLHGPPSDMLGGADITEIEGPDLTGLKVETGFPEREGRSSLDQDDGRAGADEDPRQRASSADSEPDPTIPHPSDPKIANPTRYERKSLDDYKDEDFL